MARHVKGVLFVDYVRMLRAHRHLHWQPYLREVDLPYLEQRIQPAAWYPLETFERIGLALLGCVAHGDLVRVRQWGRLSAAELASSIDGIVVPGDPRESLMRFQVYRSSFFDFEAVTLLSIDDRAADVQITYGLSPRAEEAASIQGQGFFEGLIELADGCDIESEFAECSWNGASRTLLRLGWSLPAGTGAA